MKNINTLVLLVSSIIILSSCASNHEFSKRKYLDGFNGNESQVFNSPKQETRIKNTIIPIEKISYEELLTADLSASTADVTPVVFAENQKNSISKVNFNNAVVHETKLTLKDKIAVAQTIKTINKLNNSQAELKQGNIIEVVLAFFIPPLAVFLHNGLDTNFWISLILTCLLWVPGVVFSLLVVLDMI